MDDSLAAIAERIRQAREQAGLGQGELGGLIGVSARQVRNYETAESKPYDKLDQIAAATGQSKEWLLTGVSVEERLRRVEEDRDEIRQMLAEIRSSVRELLRPPEGLLPPHGDDPNTSRDPDEPETDEEGTPPPSS